MQSYKYKFSLIFILLIVFIVVKGCNKDYFSVGMDLYDSQFENIKNINFPVYSYQKSLERVQTNNLSNVQLGFFNNEFFGKTNSGFISQLDISTFQRFGNYTQEQENNGDLTDIRVINENEKITAVYLDLPFFNNTNDSDNDGVIDIYDSDPNDSNSDSDNDGLSDITEREAGTNPLSNDSDNDGILDPQDQDNSTYVQTTQLYEIDSIYGNRNAEFDLKVFDLQYYLSSLDPNNNFESIKEYYSDDDFHKMGYFKSTLYEGTFKPNFDAIPVYNLEDDPLTEIDELTQINYFESPRIRVPLNVEFFQRYIFNLEGSDKLSNQDNFNDYFKGIIVKAENFSDDLYMLLDISNAQILMEYTYDFYNVNETYEDTSDDVVEKKNNTFSIPLGGIYFNLHDYENTNQIISNELIASSKNISTEKIYLNGSKYISKLKLFTEDNTSSVELNNFKSKNILLNEASIILHLDENINKADNVFLPERLYMYSFNDGQTLEDYNKDFSIDYNPNSNNSDKYVFGGFLQYDSNNNPIAYKFNITNHVSNIIRHDSLNIDLGLTITSDIGDVSLKSGYLHDQKRLNVPNASLSLPFPIALFGSNTNNKDLSKRVKLEVLYTEY